MWSGGPKTYLGIAIAGFPNLFMIGGPGSPSVLSNVVMTNEFQVDWVAGLIEYTRQRGAFRVEAHVDHEQRWTEHVNELVTHSLLATTNSWYVGANVPGKPRVILPYTGGIVAYRAECESAQGKQYEGFAFTRNGAGDGDDAGDGVLVLSKEGRAP